MKYIILAIFFTFLASCNKSDPNPELSDEIYKDYAQELEIATKALEAEESAHEKLLEEKNKVVPQTGQIKYVTKKINDSEKRVDAIKQQKQFFEIKLELRKNEVQQRYKESRAGGRKWPDPEEINIYKSTIKLQRDKIAWDKNKGMKKDVPRGTSPKPPAGEEAEAPPSH